MRAQRSLCVFVRSSVLACLPVLLSSCAPAPRTSADWPSMEALVGDWGCEAHFQTPQGELTVPMITQVRRGMSGRWLLIHREAPGWDATTGRFVEDEYTGWDRKRAQWVTTVANNFGVTGYLTSDGFHAGVAVWDEHPFTDISLPLRARTTWRRPSDTEWSVDLHDDTLTPGAVTLKSEHCLKKEAPIY